MACAASSSVLCDHPAVLAPLLASLTADTLSTAACVSKAWQNAVQADHTSLWRSLVLSRWPGLAAIATAPASVDWRRRYRTLSRHGLVDTEPEHEDPLSQLKFLVQGRWEENGAPAFSLVGEGSGVSCMISLSIAQRVEVRDALRIEVTLPESAPLPSGWQTLEPAAAGARDGLEIEVLLHNDATSAVAHLFSLSIRKEAVSYRPAADGAARPLVGDWAAAHAALPASAGAEGSPGGATVMASVDTWAFPTNAGCGTPGASGSRAEVPWMAPLTKDINLGELLTTPPALEVKPLTLGFCVREGVPRLCSVRMEPVTRVSVPWGDIGFPLQTSGVPGLHDLLDWA